MKHTEHQDEQIVAYLTGQGTEEERAAFASRMAADPHLRRQVEEARHAMSALHQIRRADLRSQLRSLDTPRHHRVRRMARRHIYLMLSAALVGILLVRLFAC